MSKKTGRNAPCPCGSGKKYKKCCLEADRLAESEALKEQNRRAAPPGLGSSYSGREDGFEWEADRDEDQFERWDEPILSWPLDPELEPLRDLIDEGEDHAAEGAWDAALKIWWAVWEEIQGLIPEEKTSLEGLSKELGIDWSVLRLVSNLEGGLFEAAQTDPAHYERRRAFCDEIVMRFPDGSPRFIQHLRLASAESLFGLGRIEEGEDAFQALAEVYSDVFSIYLSWGDMVCLYRLSEFIPQNPDRAGEIYRMGLTKATSRHDLLRDRIGQLRELRRAEPRPPRTYLEDEDLHALVSVGLSVPGELWERLVGRGAEVVPALNALLADALWIDGDLAEGEHQAGDAPAWGLSHAAFLAARLGDPSSVPLLLELIDICQDDDWLANGLPWFPTCFGASCVDAFLQFCFDPAREVYVRAGILDGVVWAAGRFPEARPAVTAAFADALASGAWDAGLFTTWLMFSGARLDDDAVHAAILAAGARGAFDEGMFGSLDEHLNASPRDWYLGEPPVHEDDADYLSGLPDA